MTAPARRDDSMSLLTEVMRNPLDPGYAAAARARAASGDQGPARRGPALTVTLLSAVVVGALTAAAILDLRLPGTTDARTILLEEIAQRTRSADAAEARVEELRAEVQRLQEEALAADGSGVLELSRRLALQAGATPVSGPGVVLTLDDAPSAGDPLGGEPLGEDGEAERVVDYDVQIAVNGLWEAGAEAIAVNGQRLTALSAIRSAGGAILVGFRPLEPPYRIQAIGDPAELQTGFARSAASSYLSFVQQRYGLRVGLNRAEALQLPGAGSLSLRYARPRTSTGDDTMDPEVDQ